MTRPMRVVVIDDHHDHAAVLALAFEIMGHHTRVAYDGPSGLSLVLATAPHLVLVDIIIPRIRGWSIARAIRSLPLMRQPRLVAITGHAEVDDRARAMAAGFDEHYTKPIDIDTLARITGYSIN